MSARAYTIVGAGAIGGIVGASLAEAGHEVTFVEVNRDHAQVIRDTGLRLTGHRETVTSHEVLAPEDLRGPLGTVGIAVKSRHTQAAVDLVAPHLASDGVVLSLQNGLASYRIAEVVGAPRTLAASLTFGGFYEEPGVIRFAGTGAFHVGEMDGAMTDRLHQLVADLQAVQPVAATANIQGYLWAKIALGAVYFATALVDADVPDIYDKGIYQDLFGRLAGEVADVAVAQGVTLEPFDGFDPMAFASGHSADAATIAEIWANQRAYWMKIDQRRTGIWRDLAVHKRKTEIDGLIDAVVRLAVPHGIETPGLVALVERVHAVENGERGQGWDHLNELAAVYTQEGART